jgi:hypothetical protein
MTTKETLHHVENGIVMDQPAISTLVRSHRTFFATGKTSDVSFRVDRSTPNREHLNHEARKAREDKHHKC